ncbi:hypothetical protein LINPERHAP1_LOCUS32146 [Linum perenne]
MLRPLPPPRRMASDRRRENPCSSYSQLHRRRPRPRPPIS